MTEPMAADRLAEIEAIDRIYDSFLDDSHPNAAERHRRELIGEVKRLNGRLVEYVGWEPTAKEEYAHACGQLSEVQDVVRKFEAGGFQGEIGPFLAALKHALEA